MPPRAKRAASATKSSQKQVDEDSAVTSATAAAASASPKLTSSAPAVLATRNTKSSAAANIFGDDDNNDFREDTKTSKSNNALLTTKIQLQNYLDKNVSSVDQAITNDTNDFLEAVQQFSSSFSFDDKLELCCSFVSKTSSALSVYSFIKCVAIVLGATTSCAGNDNNDNADEEQEGGNNSDEIQSLRAAVALLNAAHSSSSSSSVGLRGSAVDAARRVFREAEQEPKNQNQNKSSSSGGSKQKNKKAETNQKKTLASPNHVFRVIFKVLVAALDASRVSDVPVLALVLDGIACAATRRISGNVLRDAAELLTTIGRLSSIGAPKLRGVCSAWNAPKLPAKKEAMVISGGPFKIDISPESEIRHVSVPL